MLTLAETAIIPIEPLYILYYDMVVKLLVNSGAFQGRPSAGQPLAASASLANMLTGS